MNELVQAIREQKVVLFIGAGVSRTLGLPTFAGLIDHIAEELGFDPDLFKLYGDYLGLAEYYQLKKRSIGPLRSWMDTTWHSGGIDISKSAIHRMIIDLRCPIIYTTNYDRWIEKAYEVHGVPFTKVSNVADLINVSPNKTQIVKLHGDFDDDETIVLTESSYFERLSFESPLDVKLRSDVLCRTILFIGYSLADVNIRYLLYKLHKMWHSTSYAQARPRSYIFLTNPNPVQEEVLQSRGIVPIVSKLDPPQAGLEEFLKDLLNQAFGRLHEPSPPNALAS